MPSPQKGSDSLGYESEAFAIYDVMRYVKPPIYTVCVGNAFGEAAMLLAAGEKVRDYLTLVALQCVLCIQKWHLHSCSEVSSSIPTNEGPRHECRHGLAEDIMTQLDNRLTKTLHSCPGLIGMITISAEKQC